MTDTMPIDGVRFVKELYPRLREDDAAIERYRAALDLLPPIVVARGGVLVDGFHRWQAHRREGAEFIEVDNLGELTDSEIFVESIRRNSTHGHQLSAADKKRLAGSLWHKLGHLPNAERVSEIDQILAVSERSVQAWTKDARKYEKEMQKARAWDLWLDCRTDREIGDLLDVDHATVIKWRGEKSQSCGNSPPESRQHFDVWSWTTAETTLEIDQAGTPSYPTRMPPQAVENLLWLYTEPGQTVVDPFAGGGTTIDVAKAMGRRVWASDRKPSTPTLPIHQHDITTGWPADAPRKADLILLDPPYWQQAKGRYSDDAEDLGNMTLDDFYQAWQQTVKTCADRLTDNGRLAYIVSPAECEDHSVVDLGFDMYRATVDAGLRAQRRIIVTYTTQQATGQQVTWARDSRRLLKLYRDLVVFGR